MNKRLLEAAERVLALFPDVENEHPSIKGLKEAIEWQREYSEVVAFFATDLEMIDPVTPLESVEEDLSDFFGNINEVGLEMKNGEVFRIILYLDAWGKRVYLTAKMGKEENNVT